MSIARIFIIISKFDSANRHFLQTHQMQRQIRNEHSLWTKSTVKFARNSFSFLVLRIRLIDINKAQPFTSLSFFDFPMLNKKKIFSYFKLVISRLMVHFEIVLRLYYDLKFESNFFLFEFLKETIIPTFDIVGDNSKQKATIEWE